MDKVQSALDALREKIYKEKQSSLKNLSKDRNDRLTNEWYYYAYSFIKAAESILDDTTKRDSDARVLIIPAIYNLRHSVELTLKFLLRVTEVSKDNSKDKTHNIYEQFKRLRDVLQKEEGNMKLIISKYASANITEESIIKLRANLVDSFEAIVNKYYFQVLIQETLKSADIYFEDTNNELFKYPEANNLKVSISADAVLNIEMSNIELMKEDVKELIRVLKFFDHVFKKDFV